MAGYNNSAGSGPAQFKPGWPGGASAIPSSIVEISVSCRNLIDMDVFSKSDPMCVLFEYDFTTKQYKEFGRTEVIWDNLNPDFVHQFVMEYFFEEAQKLKFCLYDIDSKSKDLSKHDFLGSMECTLGEIVSSNRIERKLVGPKVNSGSIILQAEEMSEAKEEVFCQFAARKLDKKDFFGKSDPFMTISRSNEDGTYTLIHKTEYIKRNLNPVWKPFHIKAQRLCNGDHDRNLKFEVFDWDRDGGHDFIGEFYSTLRQLNKGPSENDYEVINPKKQQKKKKYKNSGRVNLVQIRVDTIHTFLDYIKGGTELACTVAIDFTASNGNPADPSSLHYNNTHRNPNPYQLALRSVMEIIQDYDTDKLFPVLGFGARLPPEGRVSHEFFVNGHPDNPYCEGIEGVMNAYSSCLTNIQLYGPTNFAPVINHVAKFAQAHQDGSQYFILLIITDGVITDMPQTTRAIVQASHLPLSIIIIGVGNADFEAMDVLDGDDVRLSYDGKYAVRDIVQFVPMNEFVNTRFGLDADVSKARLARAVLEEIPDQFLSFMKSRNIKPKPPLQRLPPLASAPPR